MADTFDSRLKLRLQESGANSGQWGTLLNQTITNIASVFGFGTHQLTSDADATLTLSDDGASVDALKSSYLKITSSVSLTATRTLTFAPNTFNQVKYIENATSGSQSITISQGSGSSVTIESGSTKIVYFTGSGASAAVVDALANIDQGTAEFDTIRVSTIKANDGTASSTIADSTGVMTIASAVLTTADINGGTIDNTVIGGSTAAAGSFTTGTFSGNLGIGNDTSTSTVSKTFTTGHASANRGKNVQFGMSDSTFAGMEVVNAAAANTSFNAQSINFITHEGGVSVGTRMTITSDGSVGIGTSSPGELLSVKGSGNTAVSINTGNDSGDNSQLKFGDSADDDVGQINYDHGTNAMQFRTNGGSNALVIDSNGNLILKKNLVLESTSEGVDFSGVGSSAQTLGDYEEGTFTPTLSGATTAGTFTPGSGTGGRYVRVGNICKADIAIRNSTLSGAAGTTKISGLPFNAFSTAIFSISSPPMMYNFSFTNTKVQAFYMIGTTLLGIESTNGGPWSDWLIGNNSNMYMQLTIVFEVN